MANFGWAYINCSDTGSAASSGGANGPSGSIQYITGSDNTDTSTSGSANFTYSSAHNLLQLTGTFSVTGTISASHMHIEDVTVIDATGSTKFGNSNDDTHIRTGSLSVWKAAGAGYVLSASVAESRVYVTGSGGLTLSGAFQGNYRHIGVDKVTASAGDYILGVNVGNMRTDLRLPSAAAVGRGGIVIVKDEYPNDRTTGSAIHISASSGQTIDGASYYLLTGSMPAIHLYSNGATAWYVF
jgi:hypothetical protein